MTDDDDARIASGILRNFAENGNVDLFITCNASPRTELPENVACQKLQLFSSSSSSSSSSARQALCACLSGIYIYIRVRHRPRGNLRCIHNDHVQELALFQPELEITRSLFLAFTARKSSLRLSRGDYIKSIFK